MSNMNDYQKTIAYTKYARWDDAKKRRETWDETVKRYFDFVVDELKEKHNFDLNPFRQQLEEAVVNQQVLPSMRALTMAGPALKRCNAGAYNCSYLPIDSPRSFDELLYLSMSTCGVGFSVERQYVNQLPKINEHFEYTSTTIVVEDSTPGWCKALRELISLLISGQIPKYDTSKVREKGARLKVKGGYASGPEPLIELFEFTINLFRKAAGRKLTSIECHDLCCKIGEIVVCGGVRRTALISLSNLSDDRMREAKSGQWWIDAPYRALANNSAVYTEKPELLSFMKEWQALYLSRSGERGVFNREAAKLQAIKTGRRNPNVEYGTNPCAEILLPPFSFCNLTSSIIRDGDTIETLETKVRLATILGTIQSAFTNFKYLRKIWKKNVEEERLLGVSLNGIVRLFAGSNNFKGNVDVEILLQHLKKVAQETNIEWAEKIGIEPSMAITTVKPEGNSSALTGNHCNGMHAAHSPFYIRTIRGSNVDPITKFLKAQGVPNEPDLIKPNDSTVFSFPMKVDGNTLFRNDLTAVDHLEIWKTVKENWCEHNPSVTISVRESEWLDVQAWVWNNFDHLCGVSFLPYSEHNYKQAPYQEISEDEYDKLVSEFPTIDWSQLALFETEDQTTAHAEQACVGGVCEIQSFGV